MKSLMGQMEKEEEAELPVDFPKRVRWEAGKFSCWNDLARS
jgi:hypothetical protein